MLSRNSRIFQKMLDSLQSHMILKLFYIKLLTNIPSDDNGELLMNLKPVSKIICLLFFMLTIELSLASFPTEKSFAE